MAKKINFVGVDVSAKELVVSMKMADNSIVQGTFDNTKNGHKKLLKFITKSKCTAKVCMEATGILFFLNQQILFCHFSAPKNIS